MNWNNWIVIILLMILTSISTLFVSQKYLMPNFKTIDINKVVKDDGKLKKLVLENKLTKKEYRQYYNKKINLISKAVKVLTKRNDIVIIKGAIIKSDSKLLRDITNKVNKYVKENTIYIKK